MLSTFSFHYWWVLNRIFLNFLWIWAKDTWLFLRFFDDVAQLQVTHISIIYQFRWDDSCIHLWFHFFWITWALRSLYSTHAAAVNKGFRRIFLSAAVTENIRPKKSRITSESIWTPIVYFLTWIIVSEIFYWQSCSSLSFALFSRSRTAIFMDVVTLLDKFEIWFKLIKTLYLSILEKICRKELLNNFNELSYYKKFTALINNTNRQAWVVECEILINPKSKSVMAINFDMAVSDEKVSIFFKECSICL